MIQLTTCYLFPVVYLFCFLFLYLISLNPQLVGGDLKAQFINEIILDNTLHLPVICIKPLRIYRVLGIWHIEIFLENIYHQKTKTKRQKKILCLVFVTVWYREDKHRNIINIFYH